MEYYPWTPIILIVVRQGSKPGAQDRGALGYVLNVLTATVYPYALAILLIPLPNPLTSMAFLPPLPPT